MAAFDDSADSELGAACNRLAAWVEPLPAGAVIDAAAGLTEADLALILRYLYATRQGDVAGSGVVDAPPPASRRSSVPITVRD